MFSHKLQAISESLKLLKVLNDNERLSMFIGFILKETAYVENMNISFQTAIDSIDTIFDSVIENHDKKKYSKALLDLSRVSIPMFRIFCILLDNLKKEFN